MNFYFRLAQIIFLMFIHCKLTSVYNLKHLVILTESNMHSHQAIKKNVQIVQKNILFKQYKLLHGAQTRYFCVPNQYATLIPQKSVWLVNLLYGGGWGELGEESKKCHWRGSCQLWPVVRWMSRGAWFGATLSLGERGDDTAHSETKRPFELEPSSQMRNLASSHGKPARRTELAPPGLGPGSGRKILPRPGP